MRKYFILCSILLLIGCEQEVPVIEKGETTEKIEDNVVVEPGDPQDEVVVEEPTFLSYEEIDFINEAYSVDITQLDQNYFADDETDIFILRNSADFEKEIYDDVYWVPANVLGNAEHTYSSMMNLIDSRDPEYIKESITTLYDALMYIYLANFEGTSVAIGVNDEYDSEDGNHWEVHITGREALLTNYGDCSGFAAILNYLIQGDYDHTGYISYSKGNSSGHVFNHIMHNGKDYFIDLTEFEFSKIENGRRANTYDMNLGGNLITASDVYSFAEFYTSEVAEEAVILYLLEGDSVPSIAANISDSVGEVFYEKDENFEVIYKDSDSMINVYNVDYSIPNSTKWENAIFEYDSELRYGDFNISYDMRIAEFNSLNRQMNMDVYLHTESEYPIELLSIGMTMLDSNGDVLKDITLDGWKLEDKYANLSIMDMHYPGLRVSFWELDVNAPTTTHALLTVEAVDAGNRKIVKEYYIDLEQYKSKSVSLGSSSDYDYGNLRANNYFEVPVHQGVSWVSANTLGEPEGNLNELLAISDIDVLRDEINNLYELLWYVQHKEYSNGAVNKRILEDGIDWEHHPPAEVSIFSKYGDCSSMSNILKYLISDDYDEVGFLMTSSIDGSGHVFNYIYHEGYYYTIDLTDHMKYDQGGSVETGKIEDYYAVDYTQGNIHKMRELEDFVNYIQTNTTNPNILAASYSAEAVVPLTGMMEGDFLKLVVPSSIEGSLTILFSTPASGYVFVEGPENYPTEWDPYNVIFK